MNESFTFWFPAVCTLFGCLFTIFSFFLSSHLAFGRRDLILLKLDVVVEALRAILEHLTSLRVVRSNVGTSTMAMAPHGESIAETLRALRGLTTDLQALASLARETHEAATRSATDLQAPATPVLLEILAELRKMTKGDPQIQRGLRPFSLQSLLKAQAEGLAREWIQATSNPFHDLD
jgi:Fic family protein